MEICIESVDNEFKIFRPTLKDRAEWEPRIASCIRKNHDYIDSLPLNSPLMPITGSFIYAHPPNYRGCPMIHAGVEQWKGSLLALKEMGMDTLIMQAALWAELEECYYPSSCFSGMKCFDVIDPMLHAAEELEMKVYLGGYGSVIGWQDNLNSNIIKAEKRNQSLCLKELLKNYGHCIAGIYYPCETAFDGWRNHSKELFLNELYKEFCSTIKNFDNDLAIIMSPATKYIPDKMDEMIDSWATILDGVSLDIIAPQDSIGCCCNCLENLGEAFMAWNKIARNNMIRLWSNVEIFISKDEITEINHKIPASTKRITAQINNVARYVEKLVCWEALYYPTEMCGELGVELRDFLIHCSQLRHVQA